MTTFTLHTDKNITAYDATPAAQDNVVAFATEKELTKLSADWPITRFVEVWNAFAGAPHETLGADEAHVDAEVADREG